MKIKIKFVLPVLTLAGLACLNVQCTSQTNEEVDFGVTVHLQDERQVIDGFGVSEADWADDVFIHPQREQVLERLFGADGLRLNILRGEIFPHYSPDPQTFDFAIGSDISDEAVAQAAQMERNDLLRRGQYWLSYYVAHTYPDVDFMFTTWSPPAWMKEGGHATELYPASHGSLKKDHYQDYADYLTLFYQEFKEKGIRITGISPSNEPGYAAPWNSCIWTPEQMGEFIHDYLLPTFRKAGVDAKVIFGENPSWSVTSNRFNQISSQRFVNSVLKAYPDLASDEVVAAGHAYELPTTLPMPVGMRLNPIVPFQEAVSKGIHMWITEMSNIDPLTLSMEDGLHWASVWSDYFTDAQVSAILWWLGAQPTQTNESLIILDNEKGTYAEAKRFDAMGHFSRYIRPGSVCVGRSFEASANREDSLKTLVPLAGMNLGGNEVEEALRSAGLEASVVTSQTTQQTASQNPVLPEGVKVSTFKDGSSYTVVVVNPRKEEVDFSLKLDGGKAQSSLQSYTSTANLQWAEGKVDKVRGKYRVCLPPQSIVSLVGSFR